MGFLDVLFNKSESNEYEVKCFTYKMLLSHYYRLSRKFTGVDGMQVGICRESEYKKMMRPNDRWVISLILCDANKKPLIDPVNRADSYGAIFIADAVDETFSRFINGNNQMYFKPTAAEMSDRAKESSIEGKLKSVMTKLVTAFDRSVTPEMTVSMVKNYRKALGSKIVIASISVLKQEFNNSSMFNDFTDDDYVIAEYNETSDRLIQAQIVFLDEKLKALVKSNGGMVVIED